MHTVLYVCVRVCLCVCLPKKNRIKDNVVIITNRLINILCIKSEIKHAHGIISVVQIEIITRSRCRCRWASCYGYYL